MKSRKTDRLDQCERQNIEPTLDGRRVQVGELNLGAGGDGNSEKGQGRFRRFLRNLSLFMAGMYTGESCGGTPHSSRSRRDVPPKDQ